MTRTSNNTPTLDHVWLTTALVLLAARPLLTPIAPHDFWWHLAMGRMIVMERAIPTADRFSWTQAAQPFYDQSWLAQVLMYGLYALGGPALLLIAQSLVIAAAYGLLLRLCVRHTGRLQLSVGVLLLSLPLVFDNWTIRPQSYAFPLFVGTLYVLTDYREGRVNRLWLLPVLMALWVNVHGSFVLSLALVGLTCVGELLKQTGKLATYQLKQVEPTTYPQFSILNSQFLVWGTLTAAATLLNPRGAAVWGYVRDLTGNSVVRTLVIEWAPPSLARSSDWIFFAFVAFSLLVLFLTRARFDLTDVLLFGVFLLLAFTAGRNIVWFGFVAVPLLVMQIATRLPASSTRRATGAPTLNAALIALLALLLIVALPPLKGALFPPSVGAILSEETPVEAVAWLQAQPERPQRLFHPLSYGSYLTWATPEQPVFIDPRIELYPYDQWRDYINVGQGQDVEATLRKYNFDGLLLDKAQQRSLVQAMHQNSAWAVRYEDARSIYFNPTR